MTSKSELTIQEAIALTEGTLKKAAARAGVRDITKAPPKLQRSVAGGGGYQLVLVKLIERSPFNRDHFDADKLKELIVGVQQYGILQPLSLRPFGKGYQIVAGERRWLAAKAIGMAEVPAIVQEMSDREALEKQAMENLEREDLNPIDEATKYQQLIASYRADVATDGEAIEVLCKKLDRSKSTVYERLRLLKLPEKTKAAAWSGKLPASHAGLIAKLDDADAQEEITRRILKPENYETDPDDASPVMSFRRSKQLVDEAEQTLARKRDYNRLEAEFAAKGLKVLSDAENKKAFPKSYDLQPSRGSGLVGCEQWCEAGDKQWGKIVGKAAPQILARKQDGSAVMCYQAAEAMAILVKKGFKQKPLSSSGQRAEMARNREHKQRMTNFIELLGKVAAAGEAMEGPEFLRWIFERVTHEVSGDVQRRMAKRRGIEVAKNEDESQALRRALANATGKSVRGAIAEALFGSFAPSNYSSGWGEGFAPACKLLGIAPPKWKVQASGKGE